jgi:hypothetical protein
MVAYNFQTNLVISSFGVPVFSARGLTQVFTEIRQGNQVKRDVNGNPKDLSLAQFHKYHTRISCKDQRPPAIDGIWIGQSVVISCVKHLSYRVGGSPARPVVPGSNFTENGFVFYYPLLTMMITDFSDQEGEWDGEDDWFIEAEE